MDRAQFDLALSQLGPGDYEEFEQLASANAVIEYGQLRTIAATSGDGGRDALLFSPEPDETTVFQYSVSKDWNRKIRRTANRLKSTVPSARILIYVTPVEIGSEADDLKRDLRSEYQIFLDIWPRAWFLDRLNTHPQREAAAQRVVDLKVRPLLKTAGVVSDQAQALSSDEERCAAVYLMLQVEDERSGKGLSRVCFESLVRATLRETSAESTKSREQILANVFEYVANTEENVRHIDRALSKLTPKVVKRRSDTKEYHLAFDEQLRLQGRLAEQAGLKNDYLAELRDTIARLQTPFSLSDDECNSATHLTSQVVDHMLLIQGEAFASALAAGTSADIEGARIASILGQLVAKAKRKLCDAERDVILQAASSLLLRPTEPVQAFLARWSESYTLFALLKGTSDVQKVVAKLYGHGRLWLDTNVLLPVIAEDLLDAGNRSFTQLLRVSQDCGLSLHVTDGVVEELSAQMGKSLAYARHDPRRERWIGDVPFLYAAYALSGRNPASFSSWIDEFRGRIQPDEDVAAYLADEHRITRASLEEAAESLPSELRAAVQERFRAVRHRHTALDPANIDRLVSHDIECFLGVMGKRRKERQSPLGFNAWWVTLDRTASKVHRALRSELRKPPPPSPIMSPDFLIRYLELGPLRQKEARSSEEYGMPLLADIAILEGVPEDVVVVANQVRVENEGATRRAIQRKIRDTLDAAKMRSGRLSHGGSEAIEQDVLDAIESQALSAGVEPLRVPEPTTPSEKRRTRRRTRERPRSG